MRRLIIIETDESGMECHKDCEHQAGDYCRLFGKYKNRFADRTLDCLQSGALSEEIWLQQHKGEKK